jgi:hypothetical protein
MPGLAGIADAREHVRDRIGYHRARFSYSIRRISPGLVGMKKNRRG